MKEDSHLEALGMKKIPTETTAFGKINERDKEDELKLTKASAAPDKVKKDTADKKKILPAEEQTNRDEQHSETVSKSPAKPAEQR